MGTGTNDAITLEVGAPISITWLNGSADSTWNVGTSQNWYEIGALDYTGFYTADNVVFDDNAVGAQIINISEAVFPGAISVANNSTSYEFTGSPISGSTGLTKSGFGSLVLNSTNAYTGTTTLGGGYVRVGSTNALGTGTVIYNSGALSAATGLPASLGNAITYNSTTPLLGDSSVPGALTLAGTQTLTGATNFDIESPVTISGTINGAFQLTKSGPSTLALAGTGTYTSVVVSDGTLQVGAGGTTGALPSTAAINGGTTLRYFRSDSSTIANVFSGAGTLAFKGTGTSGQSAYTLTGANTVSVSVAAEAGARVQATNTATESRFGTADVTVSSGGQVYLTGGNFANNFTLNGSGWVETAGALGAIRIEGGSNVTGSVTLASDSRIASYTTSAGTISGPLIGTSALEINGTSASFTGTINYTGNGSGYTGLVTVSQGTLNLSGSLGGDVLVSSTTSGTLAGEGSITGGLTLGSLTNGGTLSINPATAGAITAGGMLTVNNTATVAFSPQPTAAGTFGVVQHGGTTATASNFTLANAATYRSPVFDTTTNPNLVTVHIDSKNLTWTGSTSAVWDVATTANFISPGPVAEMFYSVDSVTFDDTATNFSPTLAVTTLPGSTTFNNSTNAYTLTGAGAIGGGGTLTKSGTGTVTLSTANTFSGGSQLNAGRVRAGSASPLGTGTITFSGGTLSSDSTTARTLTNAWSSGGLGGLGDATDTGALTISGAGTLTGNATFNVLSTSASTQVLSGVITDGANSYSLTKTGATGSMQLSAANTYDGGTFINEGRLTASNIASYGTGAVTIASTGQAYLTASGTFTNPMSIAGTGYVESAGNLGAIRFTANTVSSAITLTADARITAYGSSGTLSGVIGESGGARVLELGGTFAGATTGGTLTVSGANTYTGGTLVTNALINMNNSAAFGTGPVTLTGAATTGRITLANGVTLSNALTLGTNVGTSGRGSIELAATSATATLSGPITVNAGVTAGGHLLTDASSTLTISGAITSASTPIVQRAGNVILSGGGSYTSYQITGLTKIGAVNGMATNATPSIGVSAAGTLDLNGFNQTLGGLAKSTNGATVTNNGANPSVLTISYTGTTNTYDGTVVNGTSAISLVKTGTGTFAVTGANTFTGGTTISAGVVQVGGAAGALGTGAVVNNSSLILARTAAGSFANAISGTGSVTQSGTGITTLTGALSYTGDTIVTSGTLSISADTLADGADVRIATGAVLDLNHSLTDTVRALYINGVAQPAGTYGSLTSTATNKLASFTGSGVLNVGGVAGYAGWAATNAGGQAANLDYDNDGIQNGVEYLMGQTGSGFTANPAIVNGKITWPKDPSAVATWVVEISSNLTSWTTATSGVVDLGTSIEYTVPTGDPKRFARLRVTAP
ncbi:MAG: autotransporter-associated beta strand repeat-containing protein [Luteolibacter sp.]